MTGSSGILQSALRSRGEEFFDALTHGIGAVLAAVGAVLLSCRAWATGDPWCVTGCCVYGITLVAVYVASTLSHLYVADELNRWFRRFDQGFIYLLIVGSYAPYALTYLRTPLWLTFFALVVAVGVAGCISKIVFAHRVQGISVWLFLALGFGEGISLFPMLGTLPAQAVAWIVAGGGCYTIGVVFLLLDIRRYRFHAIWHVLVMAGSSYHFAAIWEFVAKPH